MAGSHVLDVFPKRALKPIAPPGHARKRLSGLLIVLLLTLPSAYLFFKVEREAGLRADLRARGVETEVLNSEGRCTSRRQISGDQPLGCNLVITFRPRPEHGAKERTANVRLDEDSPPIYTPAAIYDPEDPSRVMLKPEVERDPKPDEFVLGLVLLALPAFGLLVWFGTGQGRLARAARTPRPELVRIDRVVGQQAWLEFWVCRGGKGEAVRTVLRASHKPFLVAAPPGDTTQRPWALALLDAKNQPLLMDEQLTLLNFTAQERQALLAAAHG